MKRTALSVVAMLFVPAFADAQGAPGDLCGSGRMSAQGCDAIRSRENVDVTTDPWRAIGRVNFASIQIRSHCTGTLVADDVVLTAAHCLYNDVRKSWIPPQSIQFVAGYQRGEYVASSAVKDYVLDPDQNTGSRSFNNTPAKDWALLVLETAIGGQAGVMDIAPQAEPANAAVTLIGYASARPHIASRTRTCGATTVGPLLISDCPAMTGDSGAPVLAMQSDMPRIVGVLSAVASGPEGLRTISIPRDRWAPALEELHNNAVRP